jgi:hypothetical protein
MVLIAKRIYHRYSNNRRKRGDSSVAINPRNDYVTEALKVATNVWDRLPSSLL